MSSPYHARPIAAQQRRCCCGVCDHLTRAPDAFAALLSTVQASTAAYLSKADREATGVFSAAQRHTHFLDSPRMTAVLGHSDFRFADLILHDLHQFRATYGQRVGTFLSNAGVLQVFVDDHDTARLVSDLLGQETVMFQIMAHALDAGGSGLSTSEHHAGRPLLTPNEVRNLPQQTELLFLAGCRPVLATKLTYHADPEFRGLYDAPQRPRTSSSPAYRFQRVPEK